MKNSLGEIVLAFVVVALIMGWCFDHAHQAAVIDRLSNQQENFKKLIEAKEINKTP